jgi:ammonia channel protein AmtB
MLITAQIFREQVSLDVFTLDFILAVGAVSILLAVVALGLMDSGLVQRKNVLDTWVQKIIAAMVGGLAMVVVGYAIWQWQFYGAFGIPHPLGSAIEDWWIGGSNFREIAAHLDPKLVPGADTLQVYGGFFLGFAAVLGALLHSAGVERMKALPTYVLCAVGGGLVMPVIGYLTWGSLSPLTNNGLHDFVGVFSMYILAGTWALLIAWRAGPRLGSVRPHPRTHGPHPQDLGLSAAGVGLFMVALPLAILSCGYFVPGAGYFGISLTDSGVGLVFTNVFVCYAAGGVTGALIAYKTRNPVMGLFGPVAGYIVCAAGIDIFKPWQTLLVAASGPFVIYFGIRVMQRLRIDETKVVPLALFGGVYAAIIAGFVGWGTKTGGYFGMTGTYAPQHAEITPWTQLLGVGVTLGIALVSGLALILLLEKTIGLRVSEKQELDGLDSAYWGFPPAEEERVEVPLPPPAGPPAPAVASVAAPAPPPTG